MTFIARKKNWVKNTISIGDGNLVHRSNSYARANGLRKAVAPGMWVASHAEDIWPVRKAKFTFRGFVYAGDTVVPRGADFSPEFYVKGRLVCKGAIEHGVHSGETVSYEDSEHTQHFQIEKGKLEMFLESIGGSDGLCLPDMYLMSLSAPALLGYGATNGLSGYHLSQSIDIHHKFELGDLSVGVSEKRTGKFVGLDLNWVQNGKLIANGVAIVVPKPID